MESSLKKQIRGTLPKSAEVADFLRGEIQAGRLKPGERLASLRTLAAEMGVGLQVVYSAVEQLKKEGLLVSRRGSGVFAADGHPAGPRKLRIGVFENNLHTASFDTVNAFREINREAIAQGHDVLLLDSVSHPLLGAWAKDKDGIILSGAVSDREIELVRKTGKPFLCFGNRTFKSNPPNIRMNTFEILESLYQAAAQQWSISSLGGVSGSLSLPMTGEFADCLRTLAVKYGIRFSDDSLFTDENEDGELMAETFFALPPEKRPGLLILTVYAAVGFSRYLMEHGLRARGQRPCLAVFGCIADFPSNLIFDVAVGSVYRRMARDAVSWIASLIRRDGRFPLEGPLSADWGNNNVFMQHEND